MLSRQLEAEKITSMLLKVSEESSALRLFQGLDATVAKDQQCQMQFALEQKEKGKSTSK